MNLPARSSSASAARSTSTTCARSSAATSASCGRSRIAHSSATTRSSATRTRSSSGASTSSEQECTRTRPATPSQRSPPACPREDVVYSGTNLTGADLDYLLARGVALNVDSLDQLRDVVRRGSCPSIGLRFLIDDPAKRNRIGVSPW